MAKRTTIKTYEAKLGGKKVRVTVPESPDEEDALIDAVKDSMSPAAVAAIIVALDPARVKDKELSAQVTWFKNDLLVAVGGRVGLKVLVDENGL